MRGESLRVGPVTLQVSGDNPVAGLIAEELGSASRSADSPVLTFEIGDRTARTSSGASISGSRFLMRHEVGKYGDHLWGKLAAKGGLSLYEVDMSRHPLTKDPTTVRVQLQLASTVLDRLSRPLLRLGTRDYSSLVELIAKNAIYEIVDPLLWCKLLAFDATLVHAGAVAAPDGRGVLLMGTGGVGKSTSTLSLVVERGWKYIADDLAVIAGGDVIRHPKRLQVYAYNADLVPGLSEPLLDGRPRVDQAVWKVRRRLLGSKQARRRVAADRLAGPDRVADSAPLRAAFFLTTARDADDVVVRPSDHRREARRAAAALLEEFWDFSRILNCANAIDAGMPSLSDLQVLTTAVLEKRLPSDATFELLIPPGTPGIRIADVIAASL